MMLRANKNKQLRLFKEFQLIQISTKQFKALFHMKPFLFSSFSLQIHLRKVDVPSIIKRPNKLIF